MLIENRIHWSIKRNILRDTISEDLDYAQCLKVEHDDFIDKIRLSNLYHQNIKETRSLHSTPERLREMGQLSNQREKSCDDRIFGSASSRKRFKKSSRINSRKSSISSGVYNVLNKSKSRDILGASTYSKPRRLNRDSSRDSYDSHRIIGRSSLGSIQPRNLFQNLSQTGPNIYQTEDTKDDTSVTLTSQGHANFGSQMNQMITSMKPMVSFSQTKILPKLSSNAMKILFPIREQKILFKRPGKDGQFANAKVVIKLEDVN